MRPQALDPPFRQPAAVTTLVDALTGWARERPERPAYTFLDGSDEPPTWSFADLDLRARAVAAELARRGLGGERVLVLCQPGLDFIAAFLGCLYAGAVAVPVPPPRPRRGWSRLAAVVADAAPAALLVDEPVQSTLRAAEAELPAIASVHRIAVSGLPRPPADWRSEPVAEDDLAFLQYTSGSTAEPRGVCVSHRNLVHNQELVRRAFAQSERSVIVGWLPLYHDMGLIGNVLQPLYCGARCILMPPMVFLRKPLDWLRAISRYRATTSGGPNFAYELCVRKAAEEERGELDLSSWAVAFNGAEPVRADTLERFARAFAPCGFRAEALYPCYGLAEATLFVTGGDAAAAPTVRRFRQAALEAGRGEPAAEDAAESRALVGCGRAWAEQRLRIVDPQRRVGVEAGTEGEVWVQGESVAGGYWGREQATAETFGATLEGEAGRWLRTGDLGFVLDGELFVTGRLKDLIILRGRNHYPQDLEWTVGESHPALVPGAGAAFSVALDGEERLVVVHEVRRGFAEDGEGVARAARRAVAEEHEVQLHDLVLLRAGSVLRTTSGKVRRRACRQAYLEGRLTVVARSTATDGSRDSLAATAAVPGHAELAALSQDERRRHVALHVERRAVHRLGVDGLDAAEPLTSYGLDSLRAIEIQHDLESAFGVDVSMARLLDGQSCDALVEDVLAALDRAEPAWLTAADEAAAAASPFPLSRGQRSLWVLERVTGGLPVNTLYGALRLRRTPDVEALRRAFGRLAARHGALRTSFEEGADEPLQRIGSEPRFALRVEEPAAGDAETLRRRMLALAEAPFALADGALLRVHLLPGGDGECHLVMAVHHLVADLWSLALLLAELDVEMRPAEAAAPAAAPGYAAYVTWQEATLAGERGRELRDFWRSRLADAPAALELPTDHPRPPQRSFRGGLAGRRLDAGGTAALAALARRRGTTLYTVLLAAFKALLYRYSGSRDVVVGSPSAGRTSVRWARTVGYFVNPLPLRTRLAGGEPFSALLDGVRRTALDAFEHQDMPFQVLAEELAASRDLGRSPLFQVFFVLESAPLPGSEGLAALALGVGGLPLRFAGIDAETVALPRRTAQFDLMLLAAELGDELALAFEYGSDLFEAVTVERMLDHLTHLLAAAAAEPERPVGDLPLLAAAERRALLHDFEGVAAIAEDGDTLDRLLAAQATATPAAVAVVEGVEELTYGELDRRAERLAAELRRRGARPETLVALLAERSIDSVVAIVAVLKAGAGYLPLDPHQPPARLRHLLADARRVHPVPVLLAQRAVAAGSAAPLLVDADPPVLWLGETAEPTTPEPPPSPPAAAHADNAAYVIYTSGSTGEPKGVVVSHRNVVRLFRSSEPRFAFGRDDVWTFFHSQGFDFSVWELFGALLYGGRLVVVPHLVSRSPEAFHDLLRTEGVTVLSQTPSAFRQLAATEDRWRPGTDLRLRCVVFGGEALDFRHLEGWVRRHGLELPRLVNMYGITETTVHVTWRTLGEEDRGRVESRIGEPLPDLRVALLDDRGQPVPPGVAGEIHVGGPGLARGYLGRPALTALRFVPDPFADRPGERLYRSGDFARRRADGDLEYRGRRDRQVKLRGFRVELGEIEAALRDHPQVGDAVALLRPHGTGLRIVAWVAPRDGRCEPDELRAFVADRLPEYMVPAAWVVLPALPLTVNGKLDRDALPAPEGELAPARRSPPRGDVEVFLAAQWEDLLGVAGVGREDDFFVLGGHSLLATRLVSRLREHLGVELPLRRVFDRPRLADLAVDVQALRGSAAPPVVVAAEPPDAGPPPLSFAQERLWFTHQLDRLSPAYNMPAALELAGGLSVPALAAALGEVVRRHAALRTRFPASDHGPVQEVAPPSRWRLARVDLGRLDEAATDGEADRLMHREALRPFDLAAGPVLRTTLVRRAADDHLLLVTLHHIVADGWSIGVLVQEVAALYPAFLAARRSPLPPLPLQYGDYARAQRERLQGEVLEGLLAFWRGRLGGELPILELPTDHPRPAVRSDRGAQLSVRFGRGLEQSLLAFARDHQVTPFIVLVALFQALLSRYCGEEDVIVGTDHANRLSAETEGLIGFFINLLVLRTDLGGRPALRQLVARVTDVVLDAFAHQELPFGRLVSALRPRRLLDHTPIFQVLFVFQNAPMPELELPGLRLTARPVDTGRVKFDLVVFVEESGDQLVTHWHYRTDLFARSSIERMAADYRTLAAAALAAPDRPLADFELNLDRDERIKKMEDQERRMETISGLRRRPRRGVDLAQFDPVERSALRDGELTPLVLRPRAEVDLEEWIASHRGELDADLDRHGAILLRGFGVDTSARFESIAGAVCGELFGEYGDLPHEPGDGKVYRSTPYPPDRPILFHNESAHLHEWPLRQFFHCVEVAEAGGETPIADCRRIYQRLEPALRRRFEETGLLYVRNFVEPFDVPWTRFFHTEDRSVVEDYCRRRGMEWSWRGDVLQTRQRAPAVARHPRTGEALFFNQIQVHHVSCLEPELRATLENLFAPEAMPRNVHFGDGEPIDDAVVASLIDLYRELAVEFPWQRDDVLVVDNMLIAHGRNPFRGSRKICVAMGQMVSAA